MNPPFRSCAMMVLAAAALVGSPVRADQPKPAEGNGKVEAPAEMRSRLAKVLAAGTLPEGMVVRVSACLGEPDRKGVPDTVTETWEFTADQVHRVVRGKDLQRVESRPADGRAVCKAMIEGRAIRIGERQGDGPRVGFVGTPYGRGSRSIEVEWRGETLLDLGETNGPVEMLYRKTDAEAFGALYEALAARAREAFKAEAGQLPAR